MNYIQNTPFNPGKGFNLISDNWFLYLKPKVTFIQCKKVADENLMK